MMSIVGMLLVMIFDSYDKNSINYILAKYFIDHIHEIENMTLKELSLDSHVSISAINRFLKLLGFNSFKQAKSYVKVGFDLKLKQIRNRYTYFSIEKELDKVEYLSGKNIDREQFVEQIDTLVDMLYNNQNIIILGALYPSAIFLNFLDDMVYFQKKCEFIWRNTVDYSSHIEAKEGDILFIVSLTGRLLLMKNGLYSQIQNTKGKTVLISGNESLWDKADLFIKIPTSKGEEKEDQNTVLVELLSIIKFKYYEKYIATQEK
ncbi:MurR/RpiR family transcriptional regulator [[Clostridium] spiroforme]|nr:MurR/RpiR family transcriptional regulator [Thomasclavelia spiroformis]